MVARTCTTTRGTTITMRGKTRARIGSITGQTFHMQSPLVPAILLLVTLAGVSLADHHKKVLWRAALVSLSMLTIGVVLGQIPL